MARRIGADTFRPPCADGFVGKCIAVKPADWPNQKMTSPSSRSTRPRPERRLTTLIVGGQPLLLDLLAAGLRLRGDIQVVTATSCLQAATAALAGTPPELVIVDLSLSAADLAALGAAFSAAEPPPRVITLATAEQRGDGLLKNASSGRLGQQLHATLDRSAETGDLHLEIDRLIESLGRRPAAVQPQKLLSRRELDVFTRMGLGLMNAAIAADLGISQQTVETHRKSISRKLRASRTELVRLAVLHAAQHGDGPPAAAARATRRV